MSSAICSLWRSQDHSMMVSMPGTLSLIRSTRAAARVSFLHKPSLNFGLLGHGSSDDRPLAERFVRLRGSTSSTSGSCLLWPWVIWRSDSTALPDGVSVGVGADTSMTRGSEDVLAAVAFFAPRATLARGGRGALGAVMKALLSTIRDGFIGNRPRFILLTSAIIWGLEVNLLVALGGSEDEVVIYLGGDLRGRVICFVEEGRGEGRSPSSLCCIAFEGRRCYCSNSSPPMERSAGRTGSKLAIALLLPLLNMSRRWGGLTLPLESLAGRPPAESIVVAAGYRRLAK
nr:hypothetical protein Iba_chr13eCG7380 [Ipomoea batatas]